MQSLIYHFVASYILFLKLMGHFFMILLVEVLISKRAKQIFQETGSEGQISVGGYIDSFDGGLFEGSTLKEKTSSGKSDEIFGQVTNKFPRRKSSPTKSFPLR